MFLKIIYVFPRVNLLMVYVLASENLKPDIGGNYLIAENLRVFCGFSATRESVLRENLGMWSYYAHVHFYSSYRSLSRTRNIRRISYEAHVQL